MLSMQQDTACTCPHGLGVPIPCMPMSLLPCPVRQNYSYKAALMSNGRGLEIGAIGHRALKIAYTIRCGHPLMNKSWQYPRRLLRKRVNMPTPLFTVESHVVALCSSSSCMESSTVFLPLCFSLRTVFGRDVNVLDHPPALPYMAGGRLLL